MNIKKFLLMFIICISSFMIYTNKASALIDTNSFSRFGINHYNTFPNNSNTWTGYFNQTGIFANYTGWILFTLTYYSVDNVNTSNPIINGVEILNNNQKFTCDIGTVASYSDNTTSVITYTVNCPVTLNSAGWTGIQIDKYTYGVGNFRFSEYFTFYDNQQENHEVVVQLQYSTNDILNILSTTNINNVNYLDSIGRRLDTLLSNIQTQVQQNTQINNNITDIKNDINSDNIDNNTASSSANTWSSKNASNNTITSLLTLPISLLTNITNAINTSCSSYSLGFLFGTQIILPCINLSDYIGSTLVSVIDILFSGFMIFNIGKKLIKIFNDFTNLKSNQIDEIYGGGSE